VPVFNGHAESVTAEFKKKLSAEEAKKIFSKADGIILQDDPAKCEYPLQTDMSGNNETAVGRIREDVSSDNGVVFWCVADNIRKGAATNAVQVAELVAKKLLSTEE